jgi:hypothetical protein
VSGNIEALIDADAVWIEDGLIRRVGFLKDMQEKSAQTVIDCAGTTASLLIDSHVHPVLMDFSPRQKQTDFLESEVHVSHHRHLRRRGPLAGRPTDPAGVKALAILAAKSFAKFRPGGMKVIGGAVILEKGLVEKDFEEMAREGVRVVGEIGLGSIKTPEEAAPMVQWARKNGMTVMMHTGGTSIPGSTGTATRSRPTRMSSPTWAAAPAVSGGGTSWSPKPPRPSEMVPAATLVAVEAELIVGTRPAPGDHQQRRPFRHRVVPLGSCGSSAFGRPFADHPGAGPLIAGTPPVYKLNRGLIARARGGPGRGCALAR